MDIFIALPVFYDMDDAINFTQQNKQNNVSTTNKNRSQNCECHFPDVEVSNFNEETSTILPGSHYKNTKLDTTTLTSNEQQPARKLEQSASTLTRAKVWFSSKRKYFFSSCSRKISKYFGHQKIGQRRFGHRTARYPSHTSGFFYKVDFFFQKWNLKIRPD